MALWLCPTSLPNWERTEGCLLLVGMWGDREPRALPSLGRRHLIRVALRLETPPQSPSPHFLSTPLP